MAQDAPIEDHSSLSRTTSTASQAENDEPYVHDRRERKLDQGAIKVYQREKWYQLWYDPFICTATTEQPLGGPKVHLLQLAPHFKMRL
jgi:hypothetical protein